MSSKELYQPGLLRESGLYDQESKDCVQVNCKETLARSVEELILWVPKSHHVDLGL